MNSTFRICFCRGALFAIALGLWLMQLWSATNQVRLHSEHLLRQIENRKWAAAAEFVAADYRDDWGDDRALLLQRLRLALQRFSSLTINADAPQIQLDPPIAT